MIHSRRRRVERFPDGTGGGGGFNPFNVFDTVFVHRGQSLSATHVADDPVASWTDEGEGTHAATQATGTAQPKYKTGGPNGLPYVQFDGGDALNIAAVNEVQPLTYFIVARDDIGSGNRIIINGTGNREQIWFTGVLAIFAGGAATGPTATGLGWNIITVEFANGAASNAWLGLNQEITNQNVGNSGISVPQYGTDGGNFLIGGIEECWCVRGVGLANRVDMINYLKDLTGL